MKIAKSVNRLGTEAVYSIFAKTKKLEKLGKKIIDLSLGQSDFKSPQHAVDAAVKALNDGHHGYTLPNGIIECREAVSRKIKSLYKTDIDPERIIIMPGGKPTCTMPFVFLANLVLKLYILIQVSPFMNR